MTTRGRTLTIASIVAVVAVAVLFTGQYAARKVLSSQIVCRVTAQSLEAERSAPPGLRLYTGGDHPADPNEGDVYACSSGPVPGEEVCDQVVGLTRTRLVNCRTT